MKDGKVVHRDPVGSQHSLVTKVLHSKTTSFQEFIKLNCLYFLDRHY